MAGPTFPVGIPNEGEKVSWVGDQKIDPNTGLTQSHNGNHVKWKDRPTGGQQLSDQYAWTES